MCAQSSPVKFRNAFDKLTFTGFLETRTERSLKIGNVFYRFFDDLDLKNKRKLRFAFWNF